MPPREGGQDSQNQTTSIPATGGGGGFGGFGGGGGGAGAGYSGSSEASSEIDNGNSLTFNTSSGGGFKIGSIGWIAIGVVGLVVGLAVVVKR